MRRPPLPRRLPAPRVALNVDALHLHGFSSSDREIILASLERELARLIAERGLPSGAPVHLDRLRIDCARAHHPGDAGREAARILYAKLCLSGHPGETS